MIGRLIKVLGELGDRADVACHGRWSVVAFGDLPASAVSVKSSVKPPSPMKASESYEESCAWVFRSSTRRSTAMNSTLTLADSPAMISLVIRDRPSKVNRRSGEGSEPHRSRPTREKSGIASDICGTGYHLTQVLDKQQTFAESTDRTRYGLFVRSRPAGRGRPARTGGPPHHLPSICPT